MRGLIRLVFMSAILLVTLSAVAKAPFPVDARDSVVIVFKDGHHQTLAMGEIARLDLKAPAAIVYKDGHREKISADIERVEFGDSDTALLPSRAHFIGKWEVGDGNHSRFFITLDADGDAKKTLGPPHGTWTLVDGEARITWDDGWHDAIRKVGSKHEKRAFEAGKSFDDPPSNVTVAFKTGQRPI